VVGLPGTAVIIAAAAIPGLLLIGASPVWLPAPAGSAVLGLLTAAGAWPAVAGQARGPLHRAALGALGAWWLMLAELLTGRTLLLGVPPAAAARSSWDGSASDAVSHAIWPLLTSGALLVAIVWAVGAALLPIVVRGRVAALDMVAATAWPAPWPRARSTSWRR